ncbi:MAG: SPFH domain-containing protein [Patescibacteria group bacterium]|nr:SPFH domain-containing protein [Patescibacteria group bacterium]
MKGITNFWKKWWEKRRKKKKEEQKMGIPTVWWTTLVIVVASILLLILVIYLIRLAFQGMRWWQWIIWAVVAIFLFCHFRAVPEEKRLVIQVFGKFWGILGPGLVYTIPFLMDVREEVDIREQPIELFLEKPKIDFKEGGTAVLVEPILWVKVRGKTEEEIRRSIFLLIYAISDWRVASRETTETALRAYFGTVTVEEVFERVLEGNWWKNLLEAFPQVEQSLASWGLEGRRTTISDFDWSDEVEKARRRLYESQRFAKAADFEADLKALHSGGVHGKIVNLLIAPPYNYSRERAEEVATVLVQYYKGAEEKVIIDWRGGEPEALIARIAAGIDLGREVLKKKKG